MAVGMSSNFSYVLHTYTYVRGRYTLIGVPRSVVQHLCQGYTALSYPCTALANTAYIFSKRKLSRDVSTIQTEALVAVLFRMARYLGANDGWVSYA